MSNPYGIGLCGSHRTGKTTLAAAYAKKFKIPFVKTDTSKVFADHGLDPSWQLNFENRIRIQHHVLKDAGERWAAFKGQFITDRTPIDMMAYTLADIQGHTDVDFAELQSYIATCFDETNKHFSNLVIVQPGIPLKQETGKALLNRAYIEHLNTLIVGLCYDTRLSSFVNMIPRDMTDLKKRYYTIRNVMINYNRYYREPWHDSVSI